MASAIETSSSPKYFSDQLDDEDVMLVFRKHPVVMRTGLVVGLFGPLVGVIPSLIAVQTHANVGLTFFFGGLALGCVLGLFFFLPFWISWHFSVFIVTNQRFIQITQKRLFHRAVADININQILSVNYEIAGLQETLLGFGTIMIQTYVGDLLIHDVHHPAKMQKEIMKILRDEGLTAGSYAANEDI